MYAVNPEEPAMSGGFCVRGCLPAPVTSDEENFVFAVRAVLTGCAQW